MNLEVDDKWIYRVEKLYEKTFEPFQLYLKEEKVKKIHELMEKNEEFRFLDYLPYFGHFFHYQRISKKLEEKGIELENKSFSAYCFKDIKHIGYSIWHTATTFSIILAPVIGILIKTIKN